MLDELVKLDKERMIALDMLIRKKERVAKTYNKKMKPKMVFVDDWVLKVILHMEKKHRVLVKWSPN